MIIAISKSALGRRLSIGAIIGPALFALAWIVLGILQPAIKTEYGTIGGLSGALTNPISGLGVGPNALLFNGMFIVSGLLLLMGVIGVFQTVAANDRSARHTASLALLAVSPVGLAMAGVFTLASSLALHNVAALLVFAVPIVAFAYAGFYFRTVPGWERLGTWLIAGGALTLLLLVLFVRTFDLHAVAAGLGVAGLTERILLVEIHAWYVAVGWRAWSERG